MVSKSYGMVQLNEAQKHTLQRIEDFIESDREIFILKGSAGSGKTTLIRHLVHMLRKEGRSFDLIAPTGRAAKVLRDAINKPGERYGQTIHRAIYNFNDMKIIEDETDSLEGLSFRYLYPVRHLDQVGKVCIVDEASMVSLSENRHELFRFGTDRLLPDLLTYFGIPSDKRQNKIIFIGDSAQLPPVGDSISHALSEEFFRQAGICVDQFELTEVVRQHSNSRILKNATKIRKLLDAPLQSRNQLTFDWAKDFHRVDAQDVIENFTSEFPAPALTSSVIICFTNRQSLEYNRRIRERYFPGKRTVQPGDILMIVKNHYASGVDLFNGDLVQVVSVSKNVEQLSAPLHVMSEGKRVKKTFSFTFREIEIKHPGYSGQIRVKIIDSMLDDKKGGLDVDEMKALFVNFNIRFNDEQKLREKRGKTRIKRGSEEYKCKLRSDPYFNALHVKYGYAITCHKAQGGEWEKVYVDFEGRTGLKDDHLRWCYTAVTRAKRSLAAIHPPDITPLASMRFAAIGRLKNIPSDVIQYGEPPETPFHGVQTHPVKRIKYQEIVRKLEKSGFILERVDSMEYREMYYIRKGSKLLRADATHDSTGLFSPFKGMGDEKFAADLLKLLNHPVNLQIQLEYTPRTPVLEQLHERIREAVDQIDGSIIGISDRPQNHHITYYFHLQGRVASIKFNFKSNGEITVAEPKVSDMTLKEKLASLITILQ